jgi:hypothetical protein
MAVEKEKIGPASMPQINRFVKGAAIFKDRRSGTMPCGVNDCIGQ